MFALPSGNYEYVKIADDAEFVLVIPANGTQGQECIGSTMSGEGYCASPRFIYVYLVNGQRLRVDRLTGIVTPRIEVS